MKLDQLPDDVHLTYCTNIHAGESWRDIRASLDEHVPAIKSSVAPNQPMGIGLRLSGEAAAAAREPEALASFRDQLTKLGAYVFTINSAAVLAAILPDGIDGSISTVPGAFKPNGRSSEAIAAMADNLMMAVA